MGVHFLHYDLQRSI